MWGKKVEVTCRCGKPFIARPNRFNKWIVVCPYCQTKCRADTRRKKNSTPLTSSDVAMKVRKSETISCILWLVIGIVQCISVAAIGAGIWNIVNSIIRLDAVKNICPGNPSVVTAFDERRIWIIIMAVINVVLGGVVGVVLSIYDWHNRDYVLKNRAVFEG